MPRQKMRVILASEYPEIRNFLKKTIEEQTEAVIVGHAENTVKVLTLAWNLRPDVVVIDSNLPHTVGRDGVPLSRIGGLDTAQIISEDIPNIRVVLLNNLEVKALPKHTLSPEATAFFSLGVKEADIPFTLQELYQLTKPVSPLIFAKVNLQHQTTLKQRVSNISDKAILFGGLSILGGLFLMLSIILAGAGVFLTIGGAVALVVGLGGKLAVTLWPKTRQSKPEFNKLNRAN